MKDITVSKIDLISILKENRDNHRQIVEEAWEGYRKETVKLLEDQLDRAKKGLKTNLYVSLVCPSDHTEDYERAIFMLEMDTEDMVMLSERDFVQYVQDKWEWTNQWATTNSSYTSSLIAP